MTPFVGVDGGGTSTRAVIVDGEGQALGRGESGGSLVRVDAPELAALSVAESVRAAAARAKTALPATALWAGLAGAGTRKGREAVARELQAADLAERVVVGTDVDAAFQDAFGAGAGILLIAGTGSIARARSSAGDVVQVGGWGDRLGDEGSGFAIGMEALRAVARAEDGRGRATELRHTLLDRLGLEAPRDLVGWIGTVQKSDVAGLVPEVVAAAVRGDEVAADILDRAVADLSAHVTAAAERAGPWTGEPELVLWGGLLRRGGPLRPAIERALAPLPVRLASREIDAAMGAARLAMAEPGGDQSA